MIPYHLLLTHSLSRGCGGESLYEGGKGGKGGGGRFAVWPMKLVERGPRGVRLQGYFAQKEQRTPLGPP